VSKNLLIRCLATLIFSFVLCSCSTVFLNGGTGLNSLGAPRVIEMQMQVTRGSNSYTMDLVVEVQKQGLIIIGSSFGIRVFTLSYDGNLITEGIGSKLPFYLPNKLIVDDVILALSPRSSLEVGLPKNCNLLSEGEVSQIYCDETLLVSIRRNKMPDKNDLVSLERFHPEYKVNFVISEVK